MDHDPAAGWITGWPPPKTEELLAASLEPLADSGLRRVLDPKDAALRVFGYVPWAHGAAGIARMHAFCREAANHPPPRWALAPPADVRCVQLPSRIDAANVEAALDLLEGALGAPSGLELSVAGPNAFAARLGVRLANKPFAVRAIQQDDLAWTSRPNPPLQPATTDECSLVLTTAPGSAIAPWQAVPMSERITAGGFPEVVARLREAAAGRTVNLAVQGPWTVSFAAGAVLGNRRKLRVFHFDKATGRYEPW